MVAKQIIPFVTVLRPLYEFIYPPTCLCCEAHLTEHERKICPTCRSNIRTLTADDEVYLDKLSELTARGNIAGLASAFHFENNGTLQTLVHHLKYDDMPGIGIELGWFVGTSLRPMLGDVVIHGIVPVPLHPANERARGYNQSEYICRGVKKATGLTVFPHLLQRTRQTKTQTMLNAQERQENIANAFALNSRHESVVAGSSFLIVDDIITTGATIDECAKILKMHGAQKVFAASIAVPEHARLP